MELRSPGDQTTTRDLDNSGWNYQDGRIILFNLGKPNHEYIAHGTSEAFAEPCRLIPGLQFDVSTEKVKDQKPDYLLTGDEFRTYQAIAKDASETYYALDPKNPDRNQAFSQHSGLGLHRLAIKLINGLKLPGLKDLPDQEAAQVFCTELDRYYAVGKARILGQPEPKDKPHSPQLQAMAHSGDSQVQAFAKAILSDNPFADPPNA
jgi:hypothetical protein